MVCIKIMKEESKYKKNNSNKRATYTLPMFVVNS